MPAQSTTDRERELHSPQGAAQRSRPAQRHCHPPNSCNAPRHGRSRSRRRRLSRRSHRKRARSSRRRNLRQRSRSLRSHRLHGQPHRHKSLDPSRRRSHLRGTQPRQPLRTRLDVRDRWLHAACCTRRRRHPHLGGNRSRDSSQNLLRLANRARLSRKHSQYGRRHALHLPHKSATSAITPMPSA